MLIPLNLNTVNAENLLASSQTEWMLASNLAFGCTGLHKHILSKSDSQGRRILEAAEWAIILKDYDCSGLTQVAYFHREGLSYGTLEHGWGGELIDPEPAKSKLYQLSLADGSTPDQLSQGLEVCMPDRSNNDTHLDE